MIKKAVVLAGGLGTRFLPVTKSIPKEMLTIVNKPALQYIVNEAEAAGIKQIALLINNDKEAVRRYFRPAPELEKHLEKANKPEFLKLVREIFQTEIEFVVQPEPLGSGHAVQCVREFVGGDDFALLNGDDVMFAEVSVTKQLADCHAKYGKTVIGVQKVPRERICKYGVVRIVRSEGRAHFIDKIIEKPKPEEVCSDLASLGRYIINNEIFARLDETPVAKNGELQLTDALDLIVERGNAMAYEFEARRYDMGSKLGYIEANVEFALRDPEIGADVREFLKTLDL